MSVELENIIDLYHKGALDHPILADKEQRELARLFHEGRIAATRLKDPDPANIDSLQETVRAANKASQTLIECNLRLVPPIANEYTKSGIDYLDLVQQGNLALIRALETYDYRGKAKFSTYAVDWIKKFIREYVFNNIKPIRVPIHRQEEHQRLEKLRQNLAQNLGGEPSFDELVVASGKRRRKIWTLMQNSLTFTPLSHSSTLKTVLSDGLGERVVNKITVEEILGAFEKLSPTQRQILLLHYGLKDGVFHSFSQIGKILGFTAQNASQQEKVAIKRIRTELGLEKT